MSNMYIKQENGEEYTDRITVQEKLETYYGTKDLFDIEIRLKTDIKHIESFYKLLHDTGMTLEDFLRNTVKIFDSIYDKNTIKKVKAYKEYLETVNNG